MICNHSFRAVRGFGRSFLPPACCSIHPSPIQRSTTVLGFRMTSSKDQLYQDMEESKSSQEQPPPIRRDMMYDSFGEGYGTRSDDEGFGGTTNRGIHQEFPKEKEPIPKHGQHLEEYDTSQGSEVKEKEKSE